jgi:hypothetical protein
MDLLTKVNIKPSETKIGYQDRILLLGSCFADNIGEKFSEHYFQATINPFGTLYNPASIMKAMHLSLQKGSKCYMLQHNGLWHSMMHHGSFSHPDKNELLRRYDESLERMCNALQEASTIIVTFGTSWVYEMDGMVVANCHKMPADRFRRNCMTANRIIDMWLPLLVQIPNKHWIFTVSPIRHIKDGLHANHLSKATLMQAIDTLIVNARGLNPSSSYSYFPSYEIMLDELRDYRFYAEDMVHPSSVAVDYIWQRFVETYMTGDTQSEMRTLHQLWRDCHHRFLHPGAEESIAFAERIEKRFQDLKKQYPWLE